MSYRSKKGLGSMVSLLMLVVAALLGAVSVAKVARVFVVSSRLEQITKANGIVAAPTQEQVEKAMASTRALADGLKKANLFIPAPAIRNPVQQVYAIMGDEVLINGRWYKAGEKVADVNIVAVEPTRVVIDWNGQRISLSPIQAAIEGQEGGGRGRGRPMGGTGPVVTQVGGVAGFGPGMFGFSEQDRQRLMNMTPDQRRNFFMERLGQFGGMGNMRGMRGGGFGGGFEGGGQGGRGGQPQGQFGGRGGTQGRGGGR
ncbi:MAG: hypothetical protein QHH07_03375 [Sedimentisphaerales bacterium]|nr:hypothetical protein [Sedimentisphaerales bacterium]